MINASKPSAATVLVVDDEYANVLLLERLLGRVPEWTVVGVTRSTEAMERFREVKPDMVLLDLHMPQVTGLELLREINEAQPEGSFLPVLVLTADAGSEAKRTALAAGAHDFLTKPFDGQEVLLRVGNLLRARLLHVRMEERVRERTRALDAARIEVLERLAAAGEFRDDDTGQHTKRVGSLAARIAEELGWAADQVELLRMAAPLHDLGKIGVPDRILLKPGRLSPEEYIEMQMHTLIGASILSAGATPLMQMAETIALSHHERWDGRGYPRGLGGENIPLEARIVAVADVYDALTSDRPYRGAWSPADAAREVHEQAWKHFDPVVVEAFTQVLRNRPDGG